MTKSPATRDDSNLRLAAERTLLAWIRTGLSLMGFGFVVARFGLFLRELSAARPELPAHQGSGSQWIGVSLVLIGAAVLSFAAVDHRTTLRRLALGQPLPAVSGWAGVFLAALLAALGLFVAAYLLFVTH
jgi:putative membrane protein